MRTVVCDHFVVDVVGCAAAARFGCFGAVGIVVGVLVVWIVFGSHCVVAAHVGVHLRLQILEMVLHIVEIGAFNSSFFA